MSIDVMSTVIPTSNVTLQHHSWAWGN